MGVIYFAVGRIHHIRINLRTGLILQAIESWCVYCQSEAERRILERTEDGTQFKIDTRTYNAVPATEVVSLIIGVWIGLLIIGIFPKVEVMTSQSQPKIHTVVDVESQVEAILIQVTTLLHFKQAIALVVHAYILFVSSCRVNHEAIIANGREPTYLIIIESIVPSIVADAISLLRHLQGLGIISQTSRELLLAEERLRPAVVETEIDIAQRRGVAYLGRIDEAYLIEVASHIVVLERTGERIAP